jgi:hypothetical protein
MTVKAVWHIVKESAKCIAFGARLSSNHRTVLCAADGYVEWLR